MENYANPNPNENVAQDVIAAELQYNFDYTYATTGQRFLNFLIDNILIRFTLEWVSGYAVGTLLAALAPDFLQEAVYGGTNIQLLILSYLIGAINYLFYYTLCETLFKGLTLGKLITGTKAVRDNGEPLTFKDALMRSLCRLVPINAFSAFGGHPWHDQWTNTMVIKTRE